MKKILFLFAFIMISVAGFSQTGNDTTKYTYYKFTYGEKFNRGWFLNVLDIPTDTVYSKYGVARKGTTIYVGNGTRWTAQGGLGIDGTLAIGNTSNNKSLTMLDSVAQALIQVDPPDEFISIGGYNSSGQQSGVVIDGLGGQVGLSASNGINIGSPVPGSSALFTLRQRVDQGPFNTNLYWPVLNKVAGDTIATLQDVRTVVAGGGGGGSSDVVTTITSGTSSTVPNGTNIVRFNSTGVLTYTLTLPTTWSTTAGSYNDLVIAFTSNGTITNGNPMVNLTVVNGSGHTLSYSVNPNRTYNAGESLRFHLISTIEQCYN